MLEFKQSEQTANKRVWYFQLTNIAPASEVPTGTKNGVNTAFTVLNPPQYLTLNGQTLTAGTDYTVSGLSITIVGASAIPGASDTFLSWYANAPLTGQTGRGYLSVNGIAGVLSTNTFTEIDATNMPGSYYLQLTQAEVSTLGTLSLYVKTTLSNAYNAPGMITYNDPYASQGGFVAPSNVTGGVTKAQSDDLLKKIKKMIAEQFAKYEEEEDTEEEVEQKDYDAKLDAILSAVTAPEEESIDRTDEVIAAITSIPQPEIKDYTKDFAGLKTSVGSMTPVVSQFGEAVKSFEGKMAVAEDKINNALATVKTITDGFSELEKMMAKFKDTFDTQTDMDKRFASINGKMKDETLQQIDDKLVKVGTMVANAKFEILKALNKPQ